MLIGQSKTNLTGILEFGLLTATPDVTKKRHHVEYNFVYPSVDFSRKIPLD
jgi:hypothetical protein